MKSNTVRSILIIFMIAATGVALFYLNFFKQKKNVIIINIDVLRADSINCDKEGEVNTPNLCAFVKRSVVFKHNIASSFWTTPSMGTTMTGLYPETTQFWGAKDSLDFPTIAGTLKASGYDTRFVDDVGDYVAFLGLEISRKGFNEVEAGKKIPDWKEYIQKMENDKPFFTYLYTSALHDPYLYFKKEDKKDNGSGYYFNDFGEYSEKLGSYLFNNRFNYFGQKAFDENPLLNLSSLGTEQKRKLYEYYQNSSGQLDYVIKPRAEVDFFENVALPSGGKDIKAHMRVSYDKSLNQIDKELGELLNYLSDPKIAKKTITIIYSSHGEAFGEHGLFFHTYNLYNEILHTPLIINSVEFKPKDVTQVSGNIDLFPTITSLLNIRAPKNLQGVSLVNALSYGRIAQKRYILSQTDYSNFSLAIQDEKWKFIITENGESKDFAVELYDLQNDSGEQDNIYENYIDKSKDFLEKSIKILEESRAMRKREPIPFPSNIDEEQRKEIIKRGYF